MSQEQSKTPIMRYFDHRHLKDGPLRDVSKEYTEMAEKLDKFLPAGPEKSEALRDLLKSKDSAVRAALDLTTEDQRAPQTEDGPIESITKRGDQTVIRRGGGHVDGGPSDNNIIIQMDEQRFGANGDAALRAMAQRAEAERLMRGNY